MAFISALTPIIAAQQKASALNQAAGQVKKIGEFNAQLVDVDVARKLNDVSREASRAFASQTAGFAHAGVSVGSKSALAVKAEAIDTLERQTRRVRETGKFEKDKIRFEAASQAAALKTQASTAFTSGIFQTVNNFRKISSGPRTTSSPTLLGRF